MTNINSKQNIAIDIISNKNIFGIMKNEYTIKIGASMMCTHHLLEKWGTYKTEDNADMGLNKMQNLLRCAMIY